jgi:hypothetical protein
MKKGLRLRGPVHAHQRHQLFPLVLPVLLLIAVGCGQSEPPNEVVDRAVNWELFKNHVAQPPAQGAKSAFLDYQIRKTYRENENGEAVFVYEYEARVPVRIDMTAPAIGEPQERPDGKVWLAQTNHESAAEEDANWTLINISGEVRIFKDGAAWNFVKTQR